MGQQQLILLVLATVIVGVAIVVGIRAFTENSSKANADALMQDAVRMASDAQAAIKRPDPFGGVGGFDDIDNLGVLGYAQDGGAYKNLNGRFTVASTAAGTVITGTGPDTLAASVAAQRVVVAVCGPSDTDIDGAIVLIDGNDTGQTAPTCS